MLLPIQKALGDQYTLITCTAFEAPEDMSLRADEAQKRLQPKLDKRNTLSQVRLE